MSRNKKIRSRTAPPRPKLEETTVITADMLLPAGSASIQCILTEGSFTVRSVLIGATEMDPMNPVHRFLSAIWPMIPELVKQASGSGAVTVPTGAAIDDQIRGNTEAIDALNALASKTSHTTDDMRKLDAMPANAAGKGGLAPDTGLAPEDVDAVSPPEGIVGTINMKLEDAFLSDPNAPTAGQRAAELDAAKQHAVFSRPECVFQYCPHPDECQESCLNKAAMKALAPPSEERSAADPVGTHSDDEGMPENDAQRLDRLAGEDD